MKPGRWRLVKELLEEVLEASETQRGQLLDERCTDDPELRREVEALLAADEQAGSFLEVQAPAGTGSLSGEEEVGGYDLLRAIAGGAEGVSEAPGTQASKTSHRVQELVRRHRLGAVLGAVVVLALLLALAAGGVALGRARRAAATAQGEAEAARQFSDFLIEVFEVSGPDGAVSSRPVTAREILDRGAKRIRGPLQDQPLVRARVSHIMGALYGGLGFPKESAALYRDALEARTAVHGEGSLEAAETLLALGLVEARLGRHDEAEGLVRRSLDLRIRLLDGGDRRVARSLAGLAFVLGQMGRLAESQGLYERALAIYWEGPHLDDPHAAETVHALGLVHAARGDSSRAEELLRLAVAMGERDLGPDHPSVGLRLASLGALNRDLGRYEDAESFLGRSLLVLREAFDDDDPTIGGVLCELGSVYAVQGRHDEAEALLQEATANGKVPLIDGRECGAGAVLLREAER